MHSGTNEPNSNSELTDESSLHTAMFPHGYSVNQNAMAGFPLPFEPPMNFSYTQLPIPHESWNVLSGREIIKDFPNGTSFQDIQGQGVLPLPAPAAFDHNTNYGLPLDVITRWPGGNELVLDNPGPCRFTNELSLSLATSTPPCVVPGISVQEHRGSEMSSSGGRSSSSNSLSVTFNSSKAAPISALLSGSKFLPAVQEILAEIACCTLENVNLITYSGAANAIDPAENHTVLASTTRFKSMLLQEHEVEAKKKHLMSLLQVVDEQYSQCVDEIHTVVSAFHAVTELDPNLHARFALPTISLMYKKLRERISRHILAIGAQGQADEHNPFEASFVQKQWVLQQQLRKRDHHLWKPQRGLPERSVSVLRAWMFQNFLHPYPRDAEKHLLAIKSGLTRSQVSNWFINARVRLWKPMIEEMYAEMNRRKARRNGEENNGCTSVRNNNQLSLENITYTMN